MRTLSSDQIKEDDPKAIGVDCDGQSLVVEEVLRQVPLRPVDGTKSGVDRLALLLTDLPSDPKISNLGTEVLVQQDVGRLDITMDEAGHVPIGISMNWAV